MSRIEDAVLGDVFERPAGFDLAAFWAASTARFEEAQAPVEVIARVQPGCREALERTIGPTAAATLHRVVEQEGGCIAWGGSVNLRLRPDHTHHAKRQQQSKAAKRVG